MVQPVASLVQMLAEMAVWHPEQAWVKAPRVAAGFVGQVDQAAAEPAVPVGNGNLSTFSLQGHSSKRCFGCSLRVVKGYINISTFTNFQSGLDCAFFALLKDAAKVAGAGGV